MNYNDVISVVSVRLGTKTDTAELFIAILLYQLRVRSSDSLHVCPRIL